MVGHVWLPLPNTTLVLSTVSNNIATPQPMLHHQAKVGLALEGIPTGYDFVQECALTRLGILGAYCILNVDTQCYSKAIGVRQCDSR